MKNPFFLIRVQSRGANRLALICAIIAPIIMPICLYLIALNKIGPDQFARERATLITGSIMIGLVSAPILFLIVGYLILGIAWIIKAFRR